MLPDSQGTCGAKRAHAWTPFLARGIDALSARTRNWRLLDDPHPGVDPSPSASLFRRGCIFATLSFAEDRGKPLQQGVLIHPHR